MKQLSILLPLLLFSCAATIDQMNAALGHPPYRNQHAVTSMNFDLSTCDSLSTLSDEVFQRVTYHDKRSNASININRALIMEYFTVYSHYRHGLFQKNPQCTLDIEVKPDGKAVSKLTRDTLVHDSVSFLKAKQLLDEIRFDPIPGYVFSLRISVAVTKKIDSIEIDTNLSACYISANGRSRESIMMVVMSNIANIRYAYNKRLRETPGIKGTITIKYAIDEYGVVIFCAVVKSTMHDATLENIVVDIIRSWRFCRIRRPGDVTEVIYPFTFSQ